VYLPAAIEFDTGQAISPLSCGTGVKHVSHNSSITNQNTRPPSVVRAIHQAFDDVVKTFETQAVSYMPHTRQRVRAKIARYIVDLAKHGECDFDCLRDQAMKTLHFSS
jgi:hypothetical protein